jgi:hypothetical protein
MAWSYNGIKIVTQDNSEGGKQIVARLQPISGGTTLQIFGYEDEILKISGIVIGTTDKNALKALYKTGNSYTLVTPYGNITGYLSSFNAKQRLGIISQSIIIDANHDCLDPVFDCDLEIYPV